MKTNHPPCQGLILYTLFSKLCSAHYCIDYFPKKTFKISNEGIFSDLSEICLQSSQQTNIKKKIKVSHNIKMNYEFPTAAEVQKM